MFAVPKDTQLLIFNLPLHDPSDEIKENVKLFEKAMTERTGIPCIVYDSALCEVNDFAIYQTLSPEFKKIFDKTREMLNEESGDKHNDVEHELGEGKPVAPLGLRDIFTLEFIFRLAVSFVLGLLFSHFFLH